MIPNEQKLPTLSVIMCVNCDNPWLNEAIESVLGQDIKDFEFLIGANACTDDLWAKLLFFAEKDLRIKLTRSKIGQLSYNLNRLADCAEGDYLVRMDSDDISLPNRLGALQEALALGQHDILGSAIELIDEEGQELGRVEYPASSESIRKFLTCRTVFCHPATAIRREFLYELRGYLGGFVSEDTDLWIRANDFGGVFGNLPETLLRYRLHRGQSIRSRRGYAEVSAHWLREFLLKSNLYNFWGFVFAIVKFALRRMIHAVSMAKR